MGLVLYLINAGLTDSFTEATTNRTDFPISDGFIAIKSGHTGYTSMITNVSLFCVLYLMKILVGAIISTVTDANSFDTFKARYLSCQT
jgi:hypothetical protein